MLVWFGTVRVGFSADDYLFIQQLAPIHSIMDVLRPFWHVDPNPPYWRPLSDASAALDFLIWGWSGQGFHFTNFILHLVATALVFPFARRILRLSINASALTTFVFGIAASHESNLLWPAARADTLVTIFTMLMLMAHDHAIVTERRSFILVGCASYALGLVSKENGLLALPLLAAMIELAELVHRRNTWQRSLMRFTPYVGITVIFWIVRSHFAIPMDETEPLLAEGSHSIVAFMRNAIYGVGYALLPLDLEQATEVLRRQLLGILVALLLIAVATLIVWIRLPKGERRAYIRPVLFFLVSAVVTMQSFERWRYYMPSIGLFALFALYASDLWRRWKHWAARTVIAAPLVLLLSFHIWRAISAENNWRKAADEVQQLKTSLKLVLNTHPTRPVKLNLIDVPAKLGSASVMMVGVPELVCQAEAERLGLPSLQFGVESDDHLPTEKAIDIYALDPTEGFSHIHWQKLSDTSLLISVAADSHLRLEPALLKWKGASRRDWKLGNGDVFEVGTNRVTILDADGSFARSVKIDFLASADSSWLPVFYDGHEFKIF